LYSVCSRNAFIEDGKESWVLDFLRKERFGGTIRNHKEP
jgi:hypothetical protein